MCESQPLTRNDRRFVDEGWFQASAVTGVPDGRQRGRKSSARGRGRWFAVRRQVRQSAAGNKTYSEHMSRQTTAQQ